MISFDKSRKKFVLRQFHSEGFVNQYVMTSAAPTVRRSYLPGKVLRISQRVIAPANLQDSRPRRSSWRSLKSHHWGKDFELYNEGHFKRKE
jgi:hypothetical protein